MRELDRLAGSYVDLLWHFDPAAASAAGSVSADGRLGRFDATAMREHIAAFRAIAAAIEELDVEALDDEIDRTALLDDVRATMLRLEEDRPQVRDPGFWLGHLTQAFAVLLLRPADAETEGTRASAVAERVAAIPDFLDSARRVISRPPLLLVDGALAVLGPLGELLVAVSGGFGPAAPGGPDALGHSVGAALQALARFGHALRSGIEPDPNLDAAVLGAVRYDRRLSHRFSIRSSSADLARYAAEFGAETERALDAAARSAGGDWRAVLARLDAAMTDVGNGLNSELARAESLLRERGLLPPAVAAPGVVALPASLVPLSRPIRYDRWSERVVVAPRGSLSALGGQAAAFGLPGRHLQEVMARSSAGEVRRRLRSLVATEGWALYAEEVMDELGFFPSAEARLVRLARLLRAAARLAVDVGLHARGMTIAAAMAQLEHAGLSHDAAEAEVRRAVSHPTDGAAAATGRRELLALRAAAGVSANDPGALATFHRTLLAYGALAPDLAAWGMGIER